MVTILGPDRFQDAQGEPVADLMEGIARREGERLAHVPSDIDAELASKLYRKVLSETARVMLDDETNAIKVEWLELLIEDVFADYADREMTSALVQRAGTLALLEESAGDSSRRSFPRETMRSYFCAHNIFDDFPVHGASIGMHRVPLGADDFRIFNRVARRKTVDEQQRLRESLLSELRRASGHGYLRANIGGLLMAFAPLAGDDDFRDGGLVLADLELSDVWMADVLGAQQVSMVRCVVHRLDVRGADLHAVTFSDVAVHELIGDSLVKFGASRPNVTKTSGSPSDWFEQSASDPISSDPDQRWHLLEKFARISMRKYAIRSGKGNDDPAARRILDSDLWPDLRRLLEKHERLEVRNNPNAAGPKSEWFHLIAGEEFLIPDSSAKASTRSVLDELNVGRGSGI